MNLHFNPSLFSLFTNLEGLSLFPISIVPSPSGLVGLRRLKVLAMLKNKEEQELQHLPEHVVLNILCRLPVKSLIRFTCVSKRWRSLIISDPQFGNSHFQLAASHLRHSVLISAGTTPPEMLRSRFLSLSEDNLLNRNLNWPRPSESYSDILVIGSCNGLLVLGYCNSHRNGLSSLPLGQRYCRYFERLVIWNPSTGFFREIPCPNFQMGMVKLREAKQEREMSRVYYGFGQVSASDDDYKLVVIQSLGDFMVVHVFSVRANCWKIVKACYLSSYRLWSEELGTYSNGAIHWVSNREPGIFEPPVYAFDLANEEFREMPLPVLSRNEDGMEMTQIRTQVLLGGCLCVMFQDVTFQDTKKYTEFWVMKEYGMPESWVKLFGFNVHDLPDVFDSLYKCHFWDPIFIAEDGTVVIKLRSWSELIWVKCRKEEKPVCTIRYRLEEVLGYKYGFDAILYDETLVSIPEDYGDSCGLRLRGLKI
ncbi:putative F-box domain-containing protein [Rosa chinensis]|uniref:Putative F-box domain-containing protein n=1 Tax=Rosa chinensis TaxID=74649 RepID=A0A2P6SNX4_ROSCH|nr:F-box protein CPR1 [Rosa chinensis]PRQ60385.1 putative F-box domain-containing protein [Rosa chinensis]